ncbi:MAG: YopX family protein [Minisyncoccia bacterium]
MQFTGLKDKNGVEIYEGDIVKYIGQLNPDRYKLFIIEWDDKLAGFYAGGGQIQRTKGYEVIGNIYETPELLDKDKPMI